MKHLIIVALVLLTLTGCIASGKGPSELRVGNNRVPDMATGDVVWLFPVSFYTDIEQDNTNGEAVIFEFPGIFPTLSRLVGISYQKGISGSDRVSNYGLNPAISFGIASHETNGVKAWDFSLGKGVIGFGSNSKGAYTRLLWFLLIGNGQQGLDDLRNYCVFEMK